VIFRSIRDRLAPLRARGDVGRRASRRIAAVAILAIAVTYCSWLAYRHVWGAPQQHEPVSEQRDGGQARLEKQAAALRSEVAVLERQLQIERATYGDLVRQMKAISEENARLREDVALVQAIAGTNNQLQGLKLSSAQVQPIGGPGEYSYRIVLLQTGARLKPFQGSYQLVVNLAENGTRRGLVLPPSEARNEAAYQLQFRVHQRVEGTFKIDPNAVVRSVQVRVYEHGQTQPKLMQTVTLS